MSDAIDTSAEAVAAKRDYWAGHPCYELALALQAERDAALAEVVRLREALSDLEQIAAGLVREQAKMQASLGLNPDWTQVPAYLLRKYFAALAKEAPHD